MKPPELMLSVSVAIAVVIGLVLFTEEKKSTALAATDYCEKLGGIPVTDSNKERLIFVACLKSETVIFSGEEAR